MKEMTMSETTSKEFKPITTQEEFDERIKARLAREREKWEKESDTEELKSQLRTKDEEIAQIQREHYRADARRALVDELAAHGVTEEGRIERILRHVDLDEIEPAEDGNPYFGSVRRQLASVSKDMPELLKYELGTGSGIGSKEPVLTQEKPLTREEVENMNPDEVNSNWDRVRTFLGGERG
jgi:methylase of polypeptide subunit release factors